MNEDAKVAVVTGANRGIGLSVVKRLSGEGYNVAVCARSPGPELENLLEAELQGRKYKIFELDLADRANIKDAVKNIFLWNKHVTALVNCAGVAQGSLFSMTRMEDLLSVFEINYFSQLYLAQLLAKKMIRARSGSIINIVSTAGILADTGTLAYGGSKAAMIHATKVMANELGNYGIRVNAVAPSVVETDMAALMDEKSREKLDNRSALPGSIEPDDISDLVSFLISDRSKKVTGQVIRVDRGMPF